MESNGGKSVEAMEEIPYEWFIINLSREYIIWILAVYLFI